MNPVKVTLVNPDVEPGWRIVGDDVSLGKEYVIDLDATDNATLTNIVTLKSRRVRVVWVLLPTPGWMPVMLFGLKEDE